MTPPDLGQTATSPTGPELPKPGRIALYADLHCPFAYLSAYRLRKARVEVRSSIVVEHKSLALEYVNEQPTPKPVLDVEAPLLMLQEPDIPYQPWHRPLSEWPVTMWPAFEAVKCAERQTLDLSDELSWAIRVAFFAESRCISMRAAKPDLFPPVLSRVVEALAPA